MKKSVRSLFLLCIITGTVMAQKVELSSNGFRISLTAIDTLFYAEYSPGGNVSKAVVANDPLVSKMDHATGIIHKTKMQAATQDAFYSTAFYRYADGTLQAPSSQLFLQPVDVGSFKKQYAFLGALREHPSLKGYYYLTVTNSQYLTGDNILKLCNRLYAEKAVRLIEPVFIKLLKTQNPLQPWQWNISNTGNIFNSTPGADMGVLNAWNAATGAGIRVAVIDDGVELAHPDLAANMLPGFDATGNNSGGAPTANNAHGTNCAGIIASVNNTIGTIGVAFNANIIPIRLGIVTGNTFNTNDTWMANCFNAAVNNGADVISNSWGGGSPSAQLNLAIQNAVTNGRNGRGAVVLFATGNNNAAVSYPATLANVIAVGASTQCDTRKRSSSNPALVNPGVSTDPAGVSCDGENWWGSNFGTNLDVIAPGVFITTTDNVGWNGFAAGDYHDRFNGSSAACPNAAAVVALILSVNNNLTGQQARNILEQTAFKIPNTVFTANVAGQPNGTWSNQAGYGRINADLAVCRARASSFVINGPAQLCTSATYSIPNLPPGATVQWYVSSIYGQQSHSVSNNVLTLSRVTDGSTNVSANVTACGIVTAVPARVISIGGTVVTVTASQTGCETVHFDVAGAASGASYAWSSGAGTMLYNGVNTNETTSVPYNDAVISGFDIAVVTTTNTCGQTVNAGADYNPYSRGIQGLYPEYTSGDHVSVSVNTTPYDTYYRWYINNTLVKEGAWAYSYCTCYYEGPDMRVCGDNSIRVEVETSCGISDFTEGNFFRICGWYKAGSNIELYPNPASSQVTIKLNLLNKQDNKTGQLNSISSIRIIEKTGNVKKQLRYAGKQSEVSLNVGWLPADIYYLEVSDGVNTARVPLSVQR